MQPIDHSEFQDAGRPTSFEDQVHALYGDRAMRAKPLDLKVVLSLVGVGAVAFWGGLFWLALGLLSHHH